MCLDETNAMVPVSPLYLQFVTSYRQKNCLWARMTLDDLRWTFRWISNNKQYPEHQWLHMKWWNWRNWSECMRTIWTGSICSVSRWRIMREVTMPRTEIKNLRWTFCRLSHPYYIPWVSYWSGKNCGNGPLSNLFCGVVTQSDMVT